MYTAQDSSYIITVHHLTGFPFCPVLCIATGYCLRV